MAMFVFVLVATIYMFINIPKGFIPDQDTDQLSVITEAAQGTSYYQMVRVSEARSPRSCAQNPNVEALMSTVGGASLATLGGPNFGELVVQPQAARPAQELVNEIIDDLRPKLADFPGMNVYLQNPPTIRIGGQVTKSLYQFSMQSPDKKRAVRRRRRSCEAAIAKCRACEDVTSDRGRSPARRSTWISTATRPPRCSVNANQIEKRVLRRLSARSWVSTIYAAINEYEVLLELEPQYQARSARAVAAVLQVDTGTLIPLDTLATGDSRTSARRPSTTSASCPRSRSRST